MYARFRPSGPMAESFRTLALLLARFIFTYEIHTGSKRPHDPDLR